MIMSWLLALHIISVIAWFAGLFYLPRLFVYHADTTDAATIAKFKIMERKLYRIIMRPAAYATLIFGAWLVWLNPSYYLQAGWFDAKLFLLVLLYGYHGYCGYLVRVFAKDNNTRSHKFYRWFNEVPTILMIAIVILAFVKPF